MTEKLVIIGNGMAPGRMLEHLFEKAHRPIRGHNLQRRAARQL
ncbi:NAD(P)H-nitrite reductase large subunit [Rhizobium mongolense]